MKTVKIFVLFLALCASVLTSCDDKLYVNESDVKGAYAYYGEDGESLGYFLTIYLGADVEQIEVDANTYSRFINRHDSLKGKSLIFHNNHGKYIVSVDKSHQVATKFN